MPQGNVRGNPCPTPNFLIDEDTRNYMIEMRKKLRLRAEYGYWSDDIPLDFFFQRLIDELQELLSAIHEPESSEDRLRHIAEESVDVGAFGMMINRIARRQIANRKTKGTETA